MSLVTAITPEELASLQAEQTGDMKQLSKEFSEAMLPITTYHPENPKGVVRHWPDYIAHPEYTEVRPSEEGGQGPIYRTDPDRYEKAKTIQPEPGQYPQTLTDRMGTFLRMEDGSIVHRLRVFEQPDGWVTHHRRLPDTPTEVQA